MQPGTPLELKDHQARAVSRITQEMRGRCLLAHEMGLGKTLTSLAVVRHYGGPVLVVAPAGNRDLWAAEAEKCGVGPFQVFVRAPKDPGFAWPDFCIVAYELLIKDATLQRKKWNLLVCDEAHSIKNLRPSAKLSSKRSLRVLELAWTVPHLLLLTGTPQLSRAFELYPLLHAVSKGAFGTMHEFADRYACGATDAAGRWAARGSTNLPELYARMQPYVDRILKKDVLDLPDKQRTKVFLELSPEDTALLAGMAAQLAALKAQASKSSWKSMEADAYLQQCYRESSTRKIPHILQWLGAVAKDGEPLVVFAHHHVVLDALEAYFRDAGLRYGRVDGTTTPKKRAEVIAALTSGELLYGVLSLTSCGTGITLSPFHYRVAFAELQWNPGMFLQAEDRVHRINTTRPVFIYYLIARGSLDDMMFGLLSAKSARNAAAVDDAPSSFVFT